MKDFIKSMLSFLLVKSYMLMTVAPGDTLVITVHPLATDTDRRELQKHFERKLSNVNVIVLRCYLDEISFRVVRPEPTKPLSIQIRDVG